MSLYNIADLLVEMDFKSDLCLSRAAAYKAESDAEPDIVIKDKEEAIAQSREEHPELTLNEWEYMIYGSDFYRNLLRFDGMMLHASAVVVDGKAYLFSAPSGTGKSTHTSLWLKLFGDRAYIINDDKPAIRLCDGEFYVYGTPFSGKHDISRNTRAKLGGICFVTRGEENKIYPMPDNEVIVNMLDQTVRRLGPIAMDRLLTTLDKLLRQIKVYKIECNMDISAAKLSYQTMSGEKLDD